jgi:hypothetical protein
MADELAEMVGPKVYANVVAYLERQTTPAVALPHPVARQRV